MSGNQTSLGIKILVLVFLLLSVPCLAKRSGWEKKEVNWRAPGGKIKAIHYPADRPVTTLADKSSKKLKPAEKKIITKASTAIQQEEGTIGQFIVATIDSPPIDGFIPWIVVTATDARSADCEIDAVPTDTVSGDFPGDDPESDYVIGIFDTGASSHLIGNANAARLGLFNQNYDLMTSNTILVLGVVGSVDVMVSQPLGLFVGGLGVLDSESLLTDMNGLSGEINVSTAVGQTPVPPAPDLPTAIGAPAAVFYTTEFNTEQYSSIVYDGNGFAAPGINFYELDDPCTPSYSNTIPLELRPLGAIAVQYVVDIFGGLDCPPSNPSTIVGAFTTQSLFFVHSVDLFEDDKSAIDKDRFMFDTGAQVTVVGSRVGARLGFDPAEPDFEVEILGVTGETVIKPGFFIDSLQIPALGEWLSFTNVPVILLDIPSPEGGTMDGIIGMNLFTDVNFVLRGGGMFGQDDPVIEYGLRAYRIPADISPQGGDGIVDELDLAAFTNAWLSNPLSAGWNSNCDLISDAIIDLEDLAVFAQYWNRQL